MSGGFNALGVNPLVCPVPASGGTSKHTLINQCDKRLAFKVRSSNNSNYAVSVISGFVDMGKTIDVVITRKKGKPQADKLVFQFADVADDAKDSLAPFAGPTIVGEITGETVVKLSAAE